MWVCLREAAAIKQLLPLTHHAEYLIIQYHNNDGKVIGTNGSQFIEVHVEAAVTGKQNDPFIRIRHSGTDSGTHTVTHCTQTAGRTPTAGLFKAVTLGYPHLMLSNVCYNNIFIRGQGTDKINNMIRMSVIGRNRCFSDSGFFRPFVHLYNPFVMLSGRYCFCQLGKGILDITDQTVINKNILIDFGLVDIQLDDGSLFTEFLSVAGHSVREAGTGRNNQVAVIGSLAGLITAMHTDSTDEQTMRGRETAQTHDGSSYRTVNFFRKG